MGRPQCRFRLLQPEVHAHLAVHRGRGRQVLLGLCAITGAPVELAGTEVAVGVERAHAEVGGQRVRVTVVGFCLRDTGRIAVRGDLAEEADRMSPHAALASITGDAERLLGAMGCIVRSASQQVRLAERGQQQRPVDDKAARAQGLELETTTLARDLAAQQIEGEGVRCPL